MSSRDPSPPWSRRGWLGGASGFTAALASAGCTPAAQELPRPPIAQDIAVSLPQPLTHSFAYGAELMLVQDQSLPLVALAVAVRVGFRSEQPSQAGLAGLCADMLLEGCSGSDGPALRERYADFGATPFSLVTPSMLLLSCTVHRDDAPAALALMVENLRAPTLAPADFERVREDLQTSLAGTVGRPEVVSAFGLFLGSTGIEPPLPLLSIGTSSSLAALKVEDLRAWLGAHAHPAKLSFLFAGAASLDEAKSWVAGAAASWQNPAAVSDTPPDYTPAISTGPRKVYVPWEGLERDIFSFGLPHNPYGSPREFISLLADSVVGGLLMYELRTKLRASYGIDAHSWNTRLGPYNQRWTSLAADSIENALIHTRQLFDNLHANDALREDLAGRAVADMRRSLAMEMMSDFAGPDASLAQLVRIADLRLPPTTPGDRYANMLRVDGPSLSAALRNAYDPARLRMCVVGRPSSIAAARRVFVDELASTRTAAQLTGTG